MNFLPPLVAIAATTISSPLPKIEFDMIALTPKQVETKLDSIILFTPTDKEGNPMSFEFDVDGNKKKIYFAAFSPSAINFLNDRVITQSKDKELKYTYSPKSLSKFTSLIEIEKNKSKKDVLDVIYIPDPESNTKDIGIPSLSVGVNNMIESNLVSTCLGVKATISNSIFDRGLDRVVTATNGARKFIKLK